MEIMCSTSSQHYIRTYSTNINDADGTTKAIDIINKPNLVKKIMLLIAIFSFLLLNYDDTL